MSDSQSPRLALVMNRRQALAGPAAALLTASLGPTLLAACGGGGDAAPPTGGGATPQSLMIGPIAGLGSIIVGGVRFDDNSARIEDDDDGSLHNRSELKLGMVVEIQSSSIDDSLNRAVATTIRFGSELKGAVQSVDSAAQTFRMIDQTVEVRAETVFDPRLTGGFAAIAVDKLLEVHAQFDNASGHYIATRIELEDNASEFRLRGIISKLDTTAKTFNIGDAVINYSSVPAGELPALADGQKVRVRLQPAKVNGQWVATRVRNGVRRVDDVADARLRGFVTAFTSAQQFSVEGIAVDASGARFDPNEAAVKLGAFVEVRGRASNGTIVASRVKVKGAQNDDDFKLVELHGAVSALDTAAKTFVVREVKVDYSKTVVFKNGAAADLANGKQVEVKGLWSADRSTLIAATIEFE